MAAYKDQAAVTGTGGHAARASRTHLQTRLILKVMISHSWRGQGIEVRKGDIIQQ